MFNLYCYIHEKILWQATNLTGSLTNLWVSSYNITTAKAFVFHHLSSQEISQASCSCWGARLSVSIVLQRFAHGRWFRNVTQQFAVCHINSLILFKRFLNIDSVSLLSTLRVLNQTLFYGIEFEYAQTFSSMPLQANRNPHQKAY